jgi:hypothetical protein
MIARRTVEDVWIRTCLLDEPAHFALGRPLAQAGDDYPPKAALLDYLHGVRALSRSRLEGMEASDFDRRVRDPDFGEMTARELWAGVATSFAWHAGQIALTAKLLPDTPVETWRFTTWGDAPRGTV